MFERLKAFYQNKKIDASHLTEAVERGWITEKQKNEIIDIGGEG